MCCYTIPGPGDQVREALGTAVGHAVKRTREADGSYAADFRVPQGMAD